MTAPFFLRDLGGKFFGLKAEEMNEALKLIDVEPERKKREK